MTLTDRPDLALLAPVTCDLYRDVHKGIRAELFATTCTAGRIDPADRADRVALAERVGRLRRLLTAHAEHEDAAIQPVLERGRPALAGRIAEDHERLEARLAALPARADAAADRHAADASLAVHSLYVELASFTAAYLEHQDVEERVVMPALEAAVGVGAVVGLHQAILAGIPADEMATWLALMLPAMNGDERVAMLGAMRADAPADVFAGVWGLAASVLDPRDHAALAGRLGLA